jgi:MATE family multidrug resistance protein
MTMAAKASVHLVISFMAMTGALFYLFRYYIPQIYSNDVAVIELCSQLLIFAAMFQLFDGLQVVMLSILRGIGDVKRAMVYAFIAYIVVNIPLAYLLTFELGLGIIGIWIAFIVGLGFASTLFYIRYRNVLKNISNHLPK